MEDENQFEFMNAMRESTFLVKENEIYCGKRRSRPTAAAGPRFQALHGSSFQERPDPRTRTPTEFPQDAAAHS